MNFALLPITEPRTFVSKALGVASDTTCGKTPLLVSYIKGFSCIFWETLGSQRPVFTVLQMCSVSVSPIPTGRGAKSVSCVGVRESLAEALTLRARWHGECGTRQGHLESALFTTW